jgi:hypothetical protein
MPVSIHEKAQNPNLPSSRHTLRRQSGAINIPFLHAFDKFLVKGGIQPRFGGSRRVKKQCLVQMTSFDNLLHFPPDAVRVVDAKNYRASPFKEVFNGRLPIAGFEISARGAVRWHSVCWIAQSHNGTEVNPFGEDLLVQVGSRWNEIKKPTQP